MSNFAAGGSSPSAGWFFLALLYALLIAVVAGLFCRVVIVPIIHEAHGGQRPSLLAGAIFFVVALGLIVFLSILLHDLVASTATDIALFKKLGELFSGGLIFVAVLGGGALGALGARSSY